MMPLYLLKKLKLFASASKRTGTTKASACSPMPPPSFCFCQLQVQSVSITLAAEFKSSHAVSFLVTVFKGKEKLQNKSFEVQKSKRNSSFFFFLI